MQVMQGDEFFKYSSPCIHCIPVNTIRKPESEIQIRTCNVWRFAFVIETAIWYSIGEWVNGVTDEMLMERVVSGDLQALGMLFERHKQLLFGFLLRMLHDQTLAEDVLVDTFLRVQDRRATYKSGLKFTTWLYTIACHLATDTLRGRARREQLDQQLAVDEAASPLDPTLEACERNELAAAVRAAVNSLPEEQRIVILLREYEGFSYREISQVTGSTEESVRVRAHRARLTLRKKLSSYLLEEVDGDVTFAT